MHKICTDGLRKWWVDFFLQRPASASTTEGFRAWSETQRLCRQKRRVTIPVFNYMRTAIHLEGGFLLKFTIVASFRIRSKLTKDEERGYPWRPSLTMQTEITTLIADSNASTAGHINVAWIFNCSTKLLTLTDSLSTSDFLVHNWVPSTLRW